MNKIEYLNKCHCCNRHIERGSPNKTLPGQTPHYKVLWQCLLHQWTILMVASQVASSVQHVAPHCLDHCLTQTTINQRGILCRKIIYHCHLGIRSGSNCKTIVFHSSLAPLASSYSALKCAPSFSASFNANSSDEILSWSRWVSASNTVFKERS